MGKVKNLLAILLTAVLLIGGSLLPVVATRFQDKTTTNVVQYENIEALQLRLEEEALSLTYLEKVFLIMHGEGLEITDEKTIIKENDVIEATHAALTPYMELFFGKPLDNDYIHYYPVMVYDGADPSRYAYYWYVTMSLDASYDDHVIVILDDETGKLLAVEMTDPEMDIAEPYLQELQYGLSTIYFSELGISPAAEWPLEIAPTAENEAMGISVVAANYQLIDTLYGEVREVNIEIGVRTNGFYIFFV